MEDSSQNPYIPQESEAIRQKVYERQSPLGRIVKWSLILTIIVAILIGIGLFFVVPRTSAVDQAARIKLADTLQPPSQTLKRVSVSSNLGFTLNYDNRLYSSYAEVGDSSAGTDDSAALLSGETYENNDLRVTRDYNYVRIRPIESLDGQRALAPLPPELELFATVTPDDLTKAAAVPENKGLSKLSLFVKLDSDKRAAKKVADDKTVVAIDITKPVAVTLGGVDYQKVRYTTTNDNHRVSDVKYDECYYTIQNEQPYAICVSGVRPPNVSSASLVEEVFDTITFQTPKESTNAASSTTGNTSKKTSLVSPSFRLAQAVTSDDTTATEGDSEDQSPLLTVKPKYYSEAASLEAIASSQPSVVRIGTIYCADIALKVESGDTATTLTDACLGNTASGVFVSKDGYIATTGHAIRAQKKAAIGGYIMSPADQGEMLNRLQKVLDYLLKSRIILESDAEYLKTGATNGDQEALAKIQNIGSVIPDNFITALDEKYSYAVQPTDKPIVVNKTDAAQPSFAYSDSVLKANYVASDYDSSKAVQEVFGSETPSADVGLLKLDGNYQDVPVASASSVKAKDTVTIIGFPAYADASLTIDKIRNIPVATVSSVEQVYDKGGKQLIQTDASILPGNDGAPVFDSSAQLIGFAVYGLSYCPDQSCFSNGTVRPVSELSKLLDSKNITLQTGSQASSSWREGVKQYMRANYAASSSAFGAAGNDYAFNIWADPLQKLAAANQGSQSDTSLMNQLQVVMIVVLIVLVIMTIILAVLYKLHRKRIHDLRVGHYGDAATTQSSVYPQQPMQSAPLPTVPVNQQQPQPTQYQQYQQPQSTGAVPEQNVQPEQPAVPYQNPQQAQTNQPQITPPASEDPFYK